MKISEEFRKVELVEKVKKILAGVRVEKRLKFMHVCGTHENSISRFGLRGILPKNVEVIAGPGCPVCVCPAQDILWAIEISKDKNVILVSFGDMLRVPTHKGSLESARAAGGDVRIVYSADDAVKIAEEAPQKDVVFFGIGFETTAACVAAVVAKGLPDNFYIIPSFRLIPPAMELLMGIGDLRIDGFILPGHVTALTGLRDYEIFPKVYRMPSAAAGFEPVDILLAIKNLIEQIEKEEFYVHNEYSRLVKHEGNVKSQKLMGEVFEIVDAYWRGIGKIPRSGLTLKDKFSKHNALKKFDIKLDKLDYEIHPDCSCHLVMIGKINPNQCKLFSKACKPENPFGPCMVSNEGTCKVWFKYRRSG